MAPPQIYETCKAFKLPTCRYLPSCICQTAKRKGKCLVHISSPHRRQPLLQVAMPSSYLWSHSSRLGRLWKCQRTSRRQRRGRTRSSARWTRTWTANSHSRSLLRFGRVPFLCISFVHGYVSEGNLLTEGISVATAAPSGLIKILSESSFLYSPGLRFAHFSM